MSRPGLYPEPFCADAVVIGAGPAGCAAAIGLARSGARVALCERAAGPAFKPGEIVEPTIRTPLAELGLLASFESLGFLVLAGSLSLWDSDVPVEFSGMMSVHGHGALIDRQRFEQWLIDSAFEAGVDVFRQVPALTAEPIGNRWKVNWGDKSHWTSVSAPLIIEATGRGTGLVGGGGRYRNDRLVALLTYGPTGDAPHDQRLLIEVAEHGWWYAASLPGNVAVYSFMTDADLLPRTPAARSAFLDAQLAATKLIRKHAKGIFAPRRLKGFPANSSLRRVLNGPNWVAIGDAAATYDPLSGHGVSVALAKGVAIARLVTKCNDLSCAMTAYADAERATFADYLADHRKTYARAARTGRSSFWSRRTANGH